MILRPQSVGALLFVIALAFANSLAAAEPLLLRGARVHTVSGEVIEPGDVAIAADGTIAAVGPSGQIAAPEGARVVDASGKFITPGLVDAVSEVGLVDVSMEEGARDTEIGPEKVAAAYQAADAFNPDSLVVPIQRPGGVSDAIVVPSGQVVSGHAALVELDAPGPRTGRVARREVGQSIALGARGVRAHGGSRATLYGALRELYDDVAFYQKRRTLFDQNRARRLSASRLSLEALARTVGGAEPVLFWADRASDIRWALSFAAEQRLRPIIVGGAEAWRLAPELAAAKVFVILDPLANLPASFDQLAARSDNAAILERAGVPVILATFSGHDARRIRFLAGNAVRDGMSREAALRAITLEPARAFGLEATRGSIEPGKRANLVVWSGDPFEFSTRVEALYIGGEPASLQSRQSALRERYRDLDRRAKPAPRTAP